VHAFDPTPVSAQWVRRQQFPPQFQFHQIGLAGFDGMAGFLAPPKEGWTSFAFDGAAVAAAEAAPSQARIQAPVKRLTTLMRELGHDHLDLLKMDIEGAEYEVIRDLAAHPVPITQLLVEFHHGEFGHALEDTRQAINALDALGLRIFRISPTGLEYSFIKA
jgi:FkbM family methyltransferase